MLVFSTRVPLDDNVTKEDCINLFMEWITDSPHYSVCSIDYDAKKNEDYDYVKDNIAFSIRHVKNENMELSACRFENKESDAVWHNDCIFLFEDDNKSLLIQLNCNRINYKTKLPYINKPYIVRKFVEGGYCKDDAGIPVCDMPIEVDDKYFDICVQVMKGIYMNQMPVVYVSCTNEEKYVIDVKYLANQLSGVAHVFVETSKETALKLRDETDGNNAYTGYVGVYFPGEKFCYKHGIEYYKNDKEMVRAIINSVWNALMNRLDSSLYNWNQIIAIQSRQRMSEWKNISEQDKQQLNDFMLDFDSELKELKEKNERLTRENFTLKSKYDALNVALKEDEDCCFYKMGKNPNLYPSERNDLLYGILSQAQDKFEKGSRGQILIQSLLEANPKVGECDRIISEVKKIFGGDGRLNSTKKSQLKSLGFTIEEDSSHYKMIFGDNRYSFSVAKTPGDHREGSNMFSDISKMIDITKNL